VQLRIAHVVQLTLLLLVVGNLGRIPVFSTGERDAALLFNDLVVAALFLAGGVAMIQARALRLDLVTVTGGAFAAIGALAALLAVPRYSLDPQELAVSLAYLARWIFYFGIYVVVVNAVRSEDVDGVLRALERAVLVFAAFGILQSVFLPGFAQMVYPESRPYLDWDIQGRRLVSTFLDPNYAGAFILLVLFLQLARLSVGVAIPLWKPGLLLVGVVFTGSRSSLLALAVGGLLIVSVAGISRRILKWAGLLAVVLALLLPKILEYAVAYNKLQMDASALGRIVMWGRALRVFGDNWLFGIGFNTWGYVQERYGWERMHAATYGVEGGLLFIAVLTGVVGLLLYSTMLVAVARRCRRIWRDERRPLERRAFAIGTAAALLGMVVHSLFTNSLLLPFLMQPIWVLAGLSLVVLHDPVVEGTDSEPAGKAALAPFRLAAGGPPTRGYV
jgi:hypothetical protein